MLKTATVFMAVITAMTSGTIASAENAPVELVTCRMAMEMPAGIPHPPGPLIGGVQAIFVNHAPSPATEVDLKVTAIYRSEVLTAKGKFSEGVRIDKFFSSTDFTGLNYFRDEPDDCAIVRVKLADGSAWAPAHT
jgi:hypothetical protein